MTMTAQEFIYAKNLLQRNSYEVREDGDSLVVKDPVQCHRGGERRVEYKDMRITSYAAACRFVDARA